MSMRAKKFDIPRDMVLRTTMSLGMSMRAKKFDIPRDMVVRSCLHEVVI